MQADATCRKWRKRPRRKRVMHRSLPVIKHVHARAQSSSVSFFGEISRDSSLQHANFLYKQHRSSENMSIYLLSKHGYQRGNLKLPIDGAARTFRASNSRYIKT